MVVVCLCVCCRSCYRYFSHLTTLHAVLFLSLCAWCFNFLSLFQPILSRRCTLFSFVPFFCPFFVPDVFDGAAGCPWPAVLSVLSFEDRRRQDTKSPKIRQRSRAVPHGRTQRGETLCNCHNSTALREVRRFATATTTQHFLQAHVHAVPIGIINLPLDSFFGTLFFGGGLVRRCRHPRK